MRLSRISFVTLAWLFCCQVAAASTSNNGGGALKRFRSMFSYDGDLHLTDSRRFRYRDDENDRTSIQRLLSRKNRRNRQRREQLFFPSDNRYSDVEETALQQTVTDKRPRWLALWESLPPCFHDRSQWSRWCIKGLWVGSIVYMLHSIWKTATIVLDEISTEQSGMDSVFNREHVAFAVDRVQNQSREQPGGQPHNTAAPQSDRFMAALAIAQRLVSVGIPLQSTARLSVEKILSTLSRSEANLLNECMWIPARNEPPQHLWDRIIGLERVKRGLVSALATVQHQVPNAYNTLFDNSSAGVLLYGPPGCGKTMVAMALSGMTRIPCLLVTPSVLLRKYVGETNQQCRALFSLAQKLSPCIICIDELDGLFRKRSAQEHEVSRDLKIEFLQHWEGMLSRASRNLVVAATNRPFDVDEAVLRRFTQSHLVGLPDVSTRIRYLQRLLQDIPTGDDVKPEQLAAQTEGYSPSDLRRLLQTAAALGPLRESLSQPRALTLYDIQQAIQVVSSTPLSLEYRHALSQFIRTSQSFPQAALPDRGSYTFENHNGDHGPWETEWGNFYNLGVLQVDAPTFELLSNIMERLSDMAEDLSDFDEDEKYTDDDKDI